MSTPSVDECESIVHDFMHCLVQNKSDRDMCVQIDSALKRCQESVSAMKGVPPYTTYCVEEMTEYARCSIKPNTSMCANEYKILHDCKLRRRRFLFGEDLGLLKMNPQARKRW
jgi:hypothetical protein